MNGAPVWMFQYNPGNWDLETYLSEHGVIEDWRAHQHKDEMDIGQRVYLMQSGAHAGLVAAARIVRKPYPCPQGKDDLHADILIEARILPPLTRNEMREDDILSTYRPFAIGVFSTNFILRTDVAQRTEELVMPRLVPIATEPENTTIDARTRVAAAIVRRQGQPEFRRQLLEAYEGRCAITGCDAIEALEAAHIQPYLGPHSNPVTNGLLLRADIHTLFDLGLLAIEATTMTVVLAASLKTTSYADLEGTPLRIPANLAFRPNRDALEQHQRLAGL